MSKEKDEITETEQIIDDMTDNQDEEETEEIDETTESNEDKDEITDDDDLELQREIESYQTKITKLDERLAELKAAKIDEIKREAMRKRNYTDEQIDRYIGYIDGETKEDIWQSIIKLSTEIPPKNDYIDPSPMTGGQIKPPRVDPSEIGRKAFERVKHKIFPWMRGR